MYSQMHIIVKKICNRKETVMTILIILFLLIILGIASKLQKYSANKAYKDNQERLKGLGLK
jgi:hypothetical protein